MIPYFTISRVHVGPFHFATFGVLVAAGILVTYFWIVFRARNIGLDPKRASGLCAWMLLVGSVGAVLFKFAYHPADGFHHLGISSFGGIAGGLAGAAAFFALHRVGPRERLDYLNLVASRFPIGLAFGRAGCALMHDHPGIRSANWLAVRFPSGSRYDLGLLEFLFLILVVGLFLSARGQKPYLGLFLIPYGLFRFAIDRLHENPPAYFGITVDQYASIAALLVGVWAIAGIEKRQSAWRPSPASAARRIL